MQDREISKYVIGVFSLTTANVYKGYIITHKKAWEELTNVK